MTSPITPIDPVSAVDAASGRSAAFDAELARYQRQLAEWVDCPPGKTPEGRAGIAQIEDKVASVKAGLKQRETMHRLAEPPSSAGTRQTPAEPATLILSGTGGLLDTRA